MNPADDPLQLQPWFTEAVAEARVRDGGRVLQVTAGWPAQSEALLERIGAEGTLTVIEPDRYRAAAVNELDHPGLAVLGYRPEGEESFGVHDALVACPIALSDWPLNRWGQLLRNNLRPGGRFGIDLPGPGHCDQLRELWAEIGAPAEALRGWNGPAGSEILQLLRADGLRALEATLSTHVVEYPTAAVAADWLCDALDPGPADSDPNGPSRSTGPAEHRAALQLALARKSGRNTEIVLRYERLRVTGMR